MENYSIIIVSWYYYGKLPRSFCTAPSKQYCGSMMTVSQGNTMVIWNGSMVLCVK